MVGKQGIQGGKPGSGNGVKEPNALTSRSGPAFDTPIGVVARTISANKPSRATLTLEKKRPVLDLETAQKIAGQCRHPLDQLARELVSFDDGRRKQVLVDFAHYVKAWRVDRREDMAAIEEKYNCPSELFLAAQYILTAVALYSPFKMDRTELAIEPLFSLCRQELMIETAPGATARAEIIDRHFLAIAQRAERGVTRYIAIRKIEELDREFVSMDGERIRVLTADEPSVLAHRSAAFADIKQKAMERMNAQGNNEIEHQTNLLDSNRSLEERKKAVESLREASLIRLLYRAENILRERACLPRLDVPAETGIKSVLSSAGRAIRLAGVFLDGRARRALRDDRDLVDRIELAMTTPQAEFVEKFMNYVLEGVRTEAERNARAAQLRLP